MLLFILFLSEHESLNTIISDKTESSEPCWDGYQVNSDFDKYFVEIKVFFLFRVLFFIL